MLRFALLAAVLLVACDSADAPATVAAPTSTVAVTATPEPTGLPSPAVTPGPGPRPTGDRTLDAIVEAVAARDVATLTSFVRLEEIGCTTLVGLGGPPKCREGEAEGTVRSVLPVSSCEGEWSDWPAATLGRFAAMSRGLYAAVDAAAVEFPPEWPEPEVFLVFHMDGGGLPFASRLVIADGRVVMAYFGCGSTPEESAAWPPAGGALPLLAGPFDEPVAPDDAAPTAGIPAVDRVLAAVADYSAGVLLEVTRYGVAPCVERQTDVQQVACNAAKGEQAGDEVAVLPVAYCEGSLSRDAASAYLAMLGGAPRLYGVFRAPADEPDHGLWLTGTYWVVYALDVQPGAPAVRITLDATGNIVNLWYGCGATVQDLSQFGGRALEALSPA